MAEPDFAATPVDFTPKTTTTSGWPDPHILAIRNLSPYASLKNTSHGDVPSLLSLNDGPADTPANSSSRNKQRNGANEGSLHKEEDQEEKNKKNDTHDKTTTSAAKKKKRKREASTTVGTRSRGSSKKIKKKEEPQDVPTHDCEGCRRLECNYLNCHQLDQLDKDILALADPDANEGLPSW